MILDDQLDVSADGFWLVLPSQPDRGQNVKLYFDVVVWPARNDRLDKRRLPETASFGRVEPGQALQEEEHKSTIHPAEPETTSPCSTLIEPGQPGLSWGTAEVLQGDKQDGYIEATQINPYWAAFTG